MKLYPFILEPYKGMKTRYICPECQKQEKTFTRYIDTETGEYLHSSVGRCSRESKCGYHYTPKQYFQDDNIAYSPTIYKPSQPSDKKQIPESKPISLINHDLFRESLNQTAFGVNNFITFLTNLFGIEVVKTLVSRYRIASSKHWKGATIFWQIDRQGNIRTGKIMLYSPVTGKRIKQPYNHISWVHTHIKQDEFNLQQCLFGEHLLEEEEDETKPIALVESEKTAIIASVYLPNCIWLAFGGIGFNAEKCHALKGRNVILFPDLSKPKDGQLSAFEKWSNKAKEFSNIANFVVSDLLEKNATEEEREQGFDIADYLLKLNLQDFQS